MRSDLAFSIGIAALLGASLSIQAQPESSLSGWDSLLRENPSLMDEASDLEREILQLVTEGQIRDYLQGADASDIHLMSGETLEDFLRLKGAGVFDLSWYSIDGGGGTMSGGGFVLNGSVAQPDAGAMSGGEFTLTGGFLSFGPATNLETPCGIPGGIFCDPFESGDLSEWSGSLGAI